MKLKFLVAAFFCCSLISAQAQDTPQVTDEELEKYAIMMDSIEEMKITLLGEIADMVKNNESISVARYNELSKIVEDSAKLAEANATEAEVKALMAVQAKKEEGTAEINEAFKSMAKEYVGASTYNKIKKALANDQAIKEKYQTRMDELKADNEPANSEG